MPHESRDAPVRLLVEVAEGRVAAAILNNGFLEHCVRLGAAVDLLTPGAVYPPFVERYRTEGVAFTPLSFDTPVNGRGRLVRLERRLGQRLARLGLPKARQPLWAILGRRLALADAGGLADFVDQKRPHAFLTTDVNMGFGRGLVAACQRRGIPTVGNIFSWDHPYYHHASRPDRLTCWSPMAKRELIRIGGFRPEQIEVIGVPAYDPYVDPDNQWPRNRLCKKLGLDAGRPIIVFASLGQAGKFLDEADTFRALLEEIDQGGIAGRPQVVLRMHPMSKNFSFAEAADRPDVVVSQYVGYCPGLRWWPSKEEVVLAANLLRHADVCLSPGSTWSIEPAIFDTPTIVPIFNRYMPREYERFFNRGWMTRHFRFLADRELLVFPRSQRELRDAVCRALDDPTWMREERRMIRDELFGPLDGRSTERLAQATIEAASNSQGDGQVRHSGNAS